MIIINTVKVALAACASILLADALTLSNAISAGIVAILTIQPTKRETVKTAIARCIAFALALLIAFVSFSLFGYGYTGFLVYLVVFIFSCQRFGWISAMAMDSVIISHFIGFGCMNPPELLNEISIFAIGIAAGIFANLHLTRDMKKMNYIEDALDEQIRLILSRMSEKLISNDYSDYNGDCFNHLDDLIHEAELIARQNFANQLRKEDYFDMNYVAMRKAQESVLIEMYKNVRLLQGNPETIYAISNFLKKISEEYEKNNTVKNLLKTFAEIDQSMKSTPLPKTRQEFEDRAHLYTILRKIEEFLLIKADFMNTQEE
ncbi:MAG: hypothetical protein K6C69_03735 [Lachnospiraceae bacterium]|nr:hypothetical protein [Lachnospiraceae bacterium]